MEKVLTKNEDGVLVITINREERRNAIDPETSQAMEDILNAAEKDPEVRAIIITGAGEKSFCAGEDLAAYDDNGTCMTVLEHGFAGVTSRFSDKPIIAACNGTAVGGGLEIALSCDLIVAADHAKFGLTECKVGFIASTGGLVKLPNTISPKIANEMVLTGKLITAERAAEIGMINYAVPKEELMDKAMELAKTIAANAPISLKLSKKILYMSQHSSFEDTQRVCDISWDYIEKTEDAIEGPQAFLEKRTPNWQGK